MTKYIVTGREVPHLFATDKQAYCANSNRTLRAECGKLYSYAEPIAAWFGDKVLLSADSFSVTTSKHQAWARHAVNHCETVSLPRLKSVLSMIGNNDAARYIVARMKEIEALQDAAKRLRSDWKKADNARKIAALETACAFVWQDYCGNKTPWQSAVAVNAKQEKEAAIKRYTQARNQLDAGLENAARIVADCRETIAGDTQLANRFPAWRRMSSVSDEIRRIDLMGANRGLTIGSTATFEHATKIMGKKWAKECTALALAIHAVADGLQPEIDASRAVWEESEKASHAEKIAKWLAGGDCDYPRGLNVACRVIGETVETSHGARVPLTGALMLVALASQCRANGLPMDLKGRAIGPYKGNKIESDGTLVIGCHRITWEAIADCVARYEAGKAV